MNYTLQLHGERILYQVPPGLYELMSDISREVLRDHPEQVYEYIANYLDTLLKLRTNARKAAEVVDNVIANNRELFAHVDSLGITWEEANKHARLIQRTYTIYRARKQLRERARAEKEERLRKTPIYDHSLSFIEYFESLGVDYDTANTACLVIQSAFKTYTIRKRMKTMVKLSTHTIDIVVPDVDIPLVMEKPTTRDSKLLVYQQSPSPSINVGWYKPLPDERRKTTKQKISVASATSPIVFEKPIIRDPELQVYEQSPLPSIHSGWYKPDDPSKTVKKKRSVASSTSSKRDSKLLVYEQSPPSTDTVWNSAQRRGTDVSLEARRLGLYKRMSYLGKSFIEEGDETSTKPALPSTTIETPLPAYFDVEQSKVLMISESGQLDVLEEDVVTLFSTDTLHVSKNTIEVENLPSLNDLGSKPSKSESETAQELFSMIEKKSSKSPKRLTEESFKSATKAEERGVSSRISVTTQSQRSEDGKVISRSSLSSQKSRPRSSSRMEKMHVKLSEDNDSMTQ